MPRLEQALRHERATWLPLGSLLGMLVFGLGMARAQTEPAAADTGLQAALVLEKALMRAIEKAESSIVAIARVPKRQAGDRFDNLDLRQQLFEPDTMPLEEAEPTSPDFVPREFATGVIIDRAGYIVTNRHVLGDPEENKYYVWVQRKPYEVARVRTVQQAVAGDPWTDLAVLKIEANDLQPIVFGRAETLRKGMLVVTLGNPFAIARDGQPSASWGMVANLQRAASPVHWPARPELNKETLHHYGTLIQVDSRLNLGTSGGALINLQGEMIGLTTSLAPLAGYESSAGYAIPVDDTFRRTVDALKAGRVPEFGFLGIQPDNLTALERQNNRHGARVLRVIPGTPGDQAGLEDGDIITHVDGQAIHDRNDLIREMSRREVGSQVTLTVWRFLPELQRRRTQELEVTLSKKAVEARRNAFSQQAPRVWRGLQVEYATAIPQRLTRQAGSVADPKGCVGVIDVEKQSPAWHAGIRPGTFISHVENRRVTTPADFFGAVDALQGNIRLYLAGLRGSEAARTIQP